MSDLISRLKSWHHMAQGDGLEALNLTGIEAADRIEALEAQVAAADRLAKAMHGLISALDGEYPA